MQAKKIAYFHQCIGVFYMGPADQFVALQTGLAFNKAEQVLKGSAPTSAFWTTFGKFFAIEDGLHLIQETRRTE